MAADREAACAQELSAFHESSLPFSCFDAVVAKELLKGAVGARRGRRDPEPPKNAQGSSPPGLTGGTLKVQDPGPERPYA